ncbi:cyclophilin-like domain-containing protein [Lipomyces oligophaga]|uniref:cyclophilin-like domain-containing protein n=1 Tax=Lipomyces oligophaga TaxID=45792 RepID=UPI0034CF4159
MGKNTDKLYITHSEWSGPSKHSSSGGLQRKRGQDEDQTTAGQELTFDYCAVSLQPVESPVCDSDGNVFDERRIKAWLEAKATNPVTGAPLQFNSLIKLHYTSGEDNSDNSKKAVVDPVTFKPLTRHSRVVAIKTSGNVYARETIDELNIKARNWTDLVTGEKFSAKDIITLQDPRVPKRRKVIPKPNQNSLILTQEEKVKVSSLGSAPLPYNASKSTNGRAAASLTSTAATLYTRADRQILTDEEYLLEAKPRRVVQPAFVRIKTSLGNLDIEMYPKYAPRAVYNFIKLALKGYYDGVRFHRNIRNFMIQGGDPTATGRGGESIFGVPFPDEFDSPLSHDSRGVVSMANRGKNTNTSQFFILYRPSKHLDKKHTIFGKVTGGLDVLDKLEQAPASRVDHDRPEPPIIIDSVAVIIDPFAEYLRKLDEITTKETQKQKRDFNNEVTWTGKVLGSRSDKVSKKGGVGRYL